MNRYNKYLVIKIADIEKYLSDEKQLKLNALVTCIRVGRVKDGKQDQQYVCVAADWPMYEQVWKMIEAFVDGKPSEIDNLQRQIATLTRQRDFAVDAITRAIDMVGHPDNITYLQQTLDAIKESEVK